MIWFLTEYDDHNTRERWAYEATGRTMSHREADDIKRWTDKPGEVIDWLRFKDKEAES